MNYRLSRIAAICGGKFSGCDSEVRSVVTDSRSLSCELGCRPMFVAMRGANHDSHDFIAGMQSRGVRAFLVERGVEASSCTGECGFVQVDNAIEALQRLAAYHRAQFRGTVVGITGSNGKTVIKEWIAEELPEGMKYYRSPKSYNSQLGVPLSVLMLEGDEELAIFEAGISKPGEMERLERIIRPDAVIFTSIGDAHQENFINLEQKCDEKMILARSASKIIYHSYYEPLGRMVAAHFADRRPVDAAAYPEVPESVIGNAASRRNAQIVEAFCDAMHYPAPSFAAAPSVAMRLEVKEGINDSILINDAYNLDLNSLALALDYLHSVALSRRRTLVLSDISQSGLSDDELYSRVAGMVARAGIDFLIGIGPRLKRYAALFACDKEFFTATDECVARINRDAVAGRAILLKGARDFRFEKLVHLLSRKSHTTVLEVDLDAMIHNLNYFRSKLSFGTRLVAMVKAGSYGAGDFEVAQMLQHQGVDYLAVAFADEGVLLRERGISMPIVVLNADADSFDVMIANRLEPEIYSFHSLGAFADARDARGRNPLSDSCQAGYGHAPAGVRGAGDRAVVRDARRDAAGQGGFGLLAPQLRRHARRGCLYAGADRPLRPYERAARRLVALSGHPPYGQFGRHRALPRSAVRHVPSGAGALRLRVPAQRRPASRLDAQNPHRADQTPACGRCGGVWPRREAHAADYYGHDTDRLCRRAGPASGLRPLVGARGRTACADRRPGLHGQLHDRHYGHSRREGGRRSVGLLARAGQRPRNDGPRARYDFV